MPHPELAIRPGQVVEKCAVDKYAEAEVELDHDDGALVGIGEHDGRL